MSESEKLELTTNSFYNLQNINEVIVEIGIGDYFLNDLVLTIERLFPDFSKEEKKDLAVKVLKISTIIN